MSENKREQNKEGRRKQIVEAVRALIRETGDAGPSMRAIAARAKVSLATPYNLFGSKRGVVMAVLEDAREFQEKYATLKNLSAVERIFKVLSITFAYHVQDPEFYRTLWASLLDTRGGGEDLRTELIPPQNGLFWRSLLEEARRDGAIAQDIDMDVLQQTLNGQFAAVILRWLMGVGSVRELEPGAGFNYAAALCACATDDFRPEIRRRMLAFQSELIAQRAVVAED